MALHLTTLETRNKSYGIRSIHSALLDITAACIRVAVAVFVGYTLAATAWRSRHDPQDLGFVAFASVLLAALLACIRRAERLAPDSPAEERRRVQSAVWALSAVLSCAFAYRVGGGGVMPPALAVLVWCMTALVVLVGFFLLVLCEDQRYQALGDGAGDAGDGDREPYAKITPHQLVCITV
ncbi:hypothetical protein BS78_09G072900 [Paspalum vaginatum]|nr:hypothetical protein BS78_09G072900 [Paspalum vaginatum]